MNSTLHGVARVNAILSHPEEIARDFRNQGKKLTGYWCSLTPVELITAAGMVPYHISGDIREAQTSADACIENHMCGWVRSCFDLGLKGRYDFLSGIVIPHACNSMDALHSFWKHYTKLDFVHVVNTPHTLRPASHNFFRKELLNFKSVLEEVTGSTISEASIRDAIRSHDAVRRLLKQLSCLKKESPSPISGLEMLQVVRAASLIPPDQAIGLLQEVLDEVVMRKNRGPDRPRVLIYGMSLDSPDIIKLIENAGADVVMGYFCPDARTYWHDVGDSGDPLEDLTSHYLGHILCSRTYEDDRAGSLGLLMQLCQEFNVSGCVCYVLKYCDAFQVDMPDVRRALEQAGIVVLELDSDYSLNGLEGMKTRIETLVETLQ